MLLSFPDGVPVYMNIVWVCTSLVLNITILVSLSTLLSALFHHDNYYLLLGCSYSWPFLLNGRLRLSEFKYFSFCNCRPLFIRILDWACYPGISLCHICILTRGILHKGVSGFPTDYPYYPCGVWWLGATTCLLCVCSLFGDIVLNGGWFRSFTL